MKRNVDEMHPVDQLRYFRDKVYISDEEGVQLKSTGNSTVFKTCFCQVGFCTSDKCQSTLNSNNVFDVFSSLEAKRCKQDKNKHTLM